jgi:hypothetical protein
MRHAALQDQYLLPEAKIVCDQQRLWLDSRSKRPQQATKHWPLPLLLNRQEADAVQYRQWEWPLRITILRPSGEPLVASRSRIEAKSLEDGAREPPAAFDFEGECALERRRQLILKSSSQPSPRSVQPRLDRLGFDGKHLSRLLGAQALDLPQYEHFTEWYWQRVNRAFQQHANFPECDLTLWISAQCAGWKLDDLAHGFVV